MVFLFCKETLGSLFRDTLIFWPHGRGALQVSLKYFSNYRKDIQFLTKVKLMNSLLSLYVCSFGLFSYLKWTYNNRYLNPKSYPLLANTDAFQIIETVYTVLILPLVCSTRWVTVILVFLFWKSFAFSVVYTLTAIATSKILDRFIGFVTTGWEGKSSLDLTLLDLFQIEKRPNL